jgi:hypothetical protein
MDPSSAAVADATSAVRADISVNSFIGILLFLAALLGRAPLLGDENLHAKLWMRNSA